MLSTKSVFEIQDTQWENTTSNKTGTLKTDHGHSIIF